MFKFESDRHPGRRIWFGSFEETVSGLEIRGRVKMKPRMLKLSPDHWIRVDAEEVVYLEEQQPGKATWHTLRGPFHDLDAPSLHEALEKANKAGVFIQISPLQAVAPTRILGVRLQRQGNHIIELEGPMGEPMHLPLQPRRLPDLEECLEAINLGGGFLITGPDDF
ncbi:MAG: hypothetical protein AB7S38_04755 [Vulcanimicrobiota bacterium]|nr:hypothetical protein [Candidatus Eremiobacteraeota bacterium]